MWARGEGLGVLVNDGMMQRVERVMDSTAVPPRPAVNDAVAWSVVRVAVLVPWNDPLHAQDVLADEPLRRRHAT